MDENTFNIIESQLERMDEESRAEALGRLSASLSTIDFGD